MARATVFEGKKVGFENCRPCMCNIPLKQGLRHRVLKTRTSTRERAINMGMHIGIFYTVYIQYEKFKQTKNR